MSPGPLVAIDHVQLAMPAGGEAQARRFFLDLLGMQEIPKPTELTKRGGCWFVTGDVQIHLGGRSRLPSGEESSPRVSLL